VLRVGARELSRESSYTSRLPGKLTSRLDRFSPAARRRALDHLRAAHVVTSRVVV
jgi:hypothetical protein